MIIEIKQEESGERIDALLSRYGLTRSAAQRLLEAGEVFLGDAPVKKNKRVLPGEVYSYEEPEPECCKLIAQDIPLDVVYEDDDVILINKPRGMVVHPAAGHLDGTLVNALLWHCGDSLSGIGGEKRPGIVHRLDKDTSGLIIAAKNDFAHQALSAQLADRSLSRIYEAVVHGSFRDDCGTVELPIGRHPVDRKRMAVTELHSRPARTDWEVIDRYRGYTHIQCRLHTGRTHQIRVHMARLGHPLLGDGLYGAPCPEKGLEGQCLHAREMHFIHPRTGENMVFSTELPDYFCMIITHLGEKL